VFVQEGEPSLPIVGPTPYVTMREWVDASLNKLVEESSAMESPRTPTSLATSEQQHHHPQLEAFYTEVMRNEDLLFLDEARKQLLSQFLSTASTEDEGRAKKLQKGFQVHHIPRSLSLSLSLTPTFLYTAIGTESGRART
jgi:hypothetical protein